MKKNALEVDEEILNHNSTREISDHGRVVVGRYNSKMLKSLRSPPTSSSSEKIMMFMWMFGIFSLLQQIHRFATKQNAFTPPPARIRRTNVHYVRTNGTSMYGSASTAGADHNRTNVRKSVPVIVGKAVLHFPPTCTKREIDTVKYQLPDFRCKRTARTSFNHHCSFSYATRCHDAIWFKEQFIRQQNQSVAMAMQDGTVSKSTAILVGCTYGIVAANTLRMVSGNPQYKIESWKSAMGGIADLGVCPVQPFPLSPSSRITNDKSVVHCIEVTPSTANNLHNAVQKLGWQDHLVVHNAGLIMSHESLVISEGIQIPTYSLDNFVDRHQNSGSNGTVEYLRIAGEEKPFDILLGGSNSLKERIKYLEFEYNSKQSWKDHSLSEAVDLLRTYGFACYWAGSFGNIWRLTDCWLPYYDLKFWSSVACVNLNLAKPLAAKMEAMAMETLQQENDIHFMNERLVGTDGHWKAVTSLSRVKNDRVRA